MATYPGTKLVKPMPAHAMTDAAEAGRESVREYGRRRNAARLEALADAAGAGPATSAREFMASVVAAETLTGSPKTVATRLRGLGAKLAATRSANEARLSVWAVMPDGRRVRALYRRTATGWGSDGVIVDGQAYGVTAALAMLSEVGA